MAAPSRKRLGDLLVEQGLLSDDKLTEALQYQRQSNKKLGQILTERNYITEGQIIEVLEKLMGIPHLSLDNYFVDPAAPLLINESLAKKYEAVPVKRDGNRLTVAMTDPMNIFAIDDIQIATGLLVEPAIATKADVSKAIGLYYGKQKAERALADFRKEDDLSRLAATVAEETDEGLLSAPIVRLIDTILLQAVRNKASDIHIEPFEDEVVVRFRIDGHLQQMLSSAKLAHSAMVARIKIMARLDIAEKRLPQDGRIETFVEDQKIDMRISILPTVFGEKIVIRLLFRENAVPGKGHLGFTPQNLELFDKIIKSPTGLILITGPTGSGKTTTLYSVLQELNVVEKNIVTIEDPVEYTIQGVSQVQVAAKVGMTFYNGLTTILRQDPDIIMIGEMRDAQTCETAVRAAITGHLVLSTMHTNDTAATIARLIDMGVEPYLVSTAVVGVVAQRLVRVICPTCKEELSRDDPDVEAQLKTLDIDGNSMSFYKGMGCAACRNVGYMGRTAVHEVMPVTKEIRTIISTGGSIDSIRDISVNTGMTTLKESCAALVNQGVTTLDEMIRVAYNIE